MTLPEDYSSRLKLEDALILREGDVVIYRGIPEVESRLVEGRAYQVREVLPGITPASLSTLALKVVHDRLYMSQERALNVSVGMLVGDALLRVRGVYSDGVAVEAEKTFHYGWFTRG